MRGVHVQAVTIVAGCLSLVDKHRVGHEQRSCVHEHVFTFTVHNSCSDRITTWTTRERTSAAPPCCRCITTCSPGRVHAVFPSEAQLWTVNVNMCSRTCERCLWATLVVTISSTHMLNSGPKHCYNWFRAFQRNQHSNMDFRKALELLFSSCKSVRLSGIHCCGVGTSKLTKMVSTNWIIPAKSPNNSCTFRDILAKVHCQGCMHQSHEWHQKQKNASGKQLDNSEGLWVFVGPYWKHDGFGYFLNVRVIFEPCEFKNEEHKYNNNKQNYKM